MPTLLRRLFHVVPASVRRRLVRQYLRLVPDAVTHDGVVLPARHLRYGEPSFQTDSSFLASACAEARRLQMDAGLTVESRVLDIGCGTGRFLIGLLQELGTVRSYDGVDVDPAPISWCKRHLESRQPRATFHLLDVQNERYNPTGRPLDSTFRFPFADGRYSLIYCYSVFCHFITEELSVYLRECHRLLTDDGRMFMTAYLEDDVPIVTVNPEDYIQVWTQTRHCVRYNRSFMMDLIERIGFRIERFEYRSEYDGESALLLSKIPRAEGV